MSDPNSEEHAASSLDQLSQAFAEAMGRHRSTSESSPEEKQSASESIDRGIAEVLEPATDDACPTSPQTILEAILFVGHPDNEAISSESMAKLLRGVDQAEVEEVVDTLNAEYESTDMPIRIVAEGTGYRMELRQEFDHVRERFYGRIRQARLSQSAVDVLAIVAYNQPVTKDEVDKLLNGTQSSGRVLNQLVRRELLARKISGEKPKRREYVTTDRFLALFDLTQLGDLPRSEDPQ